MEKQQNKLTISYLTAALLCILAVAVDQLTKWLAVVHLKGQEPFVLIPGVFQFHYLENRGAAFGIMQNKQYLFAIGAVLILGVVAIIYGKIPPQKKYIPLKICAILLCAGAMGNLIDRIHLNYVIDFCYFNLIDFPIFNVADCYVVISCILFAYLILFHYKENELHWFSFKKGSEQ